VFDRCAMEALGASGRSSARGVRIYRMLEGRSGARAASGHQLKPARYSSSKKSESIFLM
jgi:hypothetical protein